MNFSDTEGVYTHTFEAERNVRVFVFSAHTYEVDIFVIDYNTVQTMSMAAFV